MKFVLIFWLMANPSGYAPTGTALFDDQPACVGALRAIEAAGPWTLPPGVCVPQATASAQEGQPAAPAPSTPTAPTSPAAPPPMHPTTPGGVPCPPGSPRPTC